MSERYGSWGKILRVDLTKAATTLMASIDPTWAVWSRHDALARAVVGGWCDDAWDVQRRRGEVAVVRTTF